MNYLMLTLVVLLIFCVLLGLACVYLAWKVFALEETLERYENQNKNRTISAVHLLQERYDSAMTILGLERRYMHEGMDENGRSIYKEDWVKESHNRD